MKPLISFIIFITILNASAQNSFVKVYESTNSRWGWAVRQTPDHGFIVAGTDYGVNSVPFLIKTDENGNEIWKKSYFNQPDSLYYGYDVFDSDDGDYYILGGCVKKNTDDYQPFMLKTDSEGSKVWAKFFGGEIGQSNSFVQDNVGDFVLACYKWDTLRLMKITNVGEVLWIKQPINEHFFCMSLVQSNDNGYVMVGSSNGDTPGDGSTCSLVIKTDVDGNFMWSHKYCENVNNRPESICPTSDGGYVVIGTAENYKGNRYDEADLMFYKLNSAGVLDWSKLYGDNYSNHGYSLIETPDKGLLLVGDTPNFYTYDADAYLIKTNEKGDSIWAKKIDVGNYESRCRSIQLTRDSGFVFTGYSRYHSKDNIFLVKTDRDGNVNPSNATNTKETRANLFSVYPNPAKDFIEIQTNFSPPFTIEIYNINGRLSLREVGYSSYNKIGLTGFQEGLYLLKATDKNNSLTKTFIKRD